MFVEVQLAFPFLDAPEGAAPVVSRYRRRLRDVAERAYRLGAMRAENRRLAEPPAHSLGSAAVVPMRDLSTAIDNAGNIPFWLTPVTPESDLAR